MVKNFKVNNGEVTSELKIKNFKINEENEECFSKGSMLNIEPDVVSYLDHQLSSFWIDGRIGMGFFEHFFCFFDFASLKGGLAQDLQGLVNKCQIFLGEYQKIPFFMGKAGAIIDIKTDFGVKKFLIDTGASCSILRRPSTPREKDMYVHSSQLKIGEQDYGPWRFHPFEISELYDDMDGILGIDFLKHCRLIFDFQNQVIYLNYRQNKNRK